MRPDGPTAAVAVTLHGAFAALVLLLLAGWAHPAAAQHAHATGSGVSISHDARPDGHETVGNVAHFGVLTLGDDARPDVHQQNHVRVRLNGATLLETTPDSGHDYDGVNLFDVVFPQAGNYSVEALGDAGEVLARFTGTVVDDPLRVTPAALALDAPEVVQPATPATFTFALRGSGAAILEHSDAWFEVRDATGLLLRTKTHAHAAPQTVSYAYMGTAESFTVTVTAFLAHPGPDGPIVRPVGAEAQVDVRMDLGVSAPSPVPAAPVVPDEPQTNAVLEGDGDGPYLLVGTYDPWTTVGPSTQMRLAALTMDPETREPVQHVDYTATLTERATGLVRFASASLHEYDGIWELATVQPVGEYILDVVASQGAWSSRLTMPYAVIPPAMAAMPASTDVPVSVAAPVQFVDIAGFEDARSGVPFTIHLAIRDASGLPLQHAEVDVQVLDQARIPAAALKLHTHGSGAYALNLTLPEGEYTLRLSPFPLEPRPTLTFLMTERCPAAAATAAPPCPLVEIPLSVAAGPGIPAAMTGTSSSDAARATPLPGLAVALAALALALAGRQPRSPR